MAMCPLHTDKDRALTLGHERATVIFKHSPACGSSFRAFGEVKAFVRAHPDVPVFVVDVLEQRDISAALAVELGITHESPQVIVTRGGAATWSDSHFRITAQRLAAAVVVASAHPAAPSARQPSPPDDGFAA